jgi:hypothetical protein
VPSAAQIRGAALIESLLPTGSRPPEIRIRARGRTGVAFHIWPAWQHGQGGEFMRTVVVPDAPGAERDAGVLALRHQIARLIEVEDMVAALAVLPDGMRTPAWGYHCPLALRVAMDEAGIPVEDRVALLEDDRRTFMVRGCVVTIHEINRPSDHWRSGTVRRIAIKGQDMHYRQGINRSDISVPGIIPTSMRNALVAGPARRIVDLPGLASDALVVDEVEVSERRMRTTFQLSRAFSLMASPPGARTMP